MTKKIVVISIFILSLGFSSQLFSQYLPEEVAEFEKWEQFLETANIIEKSQPWSDREAVTNPWRLKLEKDGVAKFAIWKNPSGRLKGFVENWKWEIAAYRLSKYLGLSMVPPTIEKRFQGDRGSCQIFVDYKMSLKTRVEEKIKIPSFRVFKFIADKPFAIATPKIPPTRA